MTIAANPVCPVGHSYLQHSSFFSIAFTAELITQKYPLIIINKYVYFFIFGSKIIYSFF